MQHIKPSMKFLHKRVIDPETKRPMQYIITNVTRDEVFYCPVTGGGREYCAIEVFEPRVVREWIRNDSEAAE